MLLYNTLTAKKEEFIPQGIDEVKMYVCGITPYDEMHIGHARCYVFFDVLRRYLEWKGYRVVYIQNFTDIDDKIINKSKVSGIPPKEIASRYIDEYLSYCDKLNIKPPTKYVRVTEHIPQIINSVEKLITLGYGYVIDGSVYYRVRKFKEYGKLSGRRIDELIKGVRIEPDERKEFELDFALWKKDEEFGWDSPWGKGRPGWHIECSVMAMEHLGETIDIHGGGQDLIFPHHENEIAQSEALTGKTFVKYWVHNGFVTINKEKMSKSLGNIMSLSELSKNFSFEVIRYFLLTQHYRNPIDFSIEQLEQAKSAYERISKTMGEIDFVVNEYKNRGKLEIVRLDKRNFIKTRIWMVSEEFDDKILIGTAYSEELPEIDKRSIEIYYEFLNAMHDDMNTAEAIGAIHKMSHLVNLELQKFPLEIDISFVIQTKIMILELAEILGLVFIQKEEITEEMKKYIEEQIEIRDSLRKKGKWKEADLIRGKLKEQGIILEDTPYGTRWRKI